MPLTLEEIIAQNKAEGEANSPFKRYQLVRACLSSGFNLSDGSPTSLHDCDDPEQHFNSRVIEWDLYGRIDIATEITDNPHCSTWCWLDDSLTARSGYDWFADRTDDRIWQAIGVPIYFMWEEPGWSTGTYDPIINDYYSVGETVRAVIKHPHINYGDWIVSYEKKSQRSWITRVVNERQMWPRPD